MSRINAETAVIGACLVDQQAFWKVADLITADDFATEQNRALWLAIAELRKSGMEADFVTVGEKAPGLANSALAAANAGTGSNVRGYAEWVLADAVQRRVNVAGQRMAKLTGPDTLTEAQRILAACQPRAMSAVKPIREYLRESNRLMQERSDSTSELTGLATSLPWLDEKTAGWQRGDLIIIAARPSVGKTALALQCAVHASLLGEPVFFASLEQSGVQIAERATSYLSTVPLQSIMQPKQIHEEQWTQIANAQTLLAKSPLLIDETGALTVEAISARARQANADKRLSLIVIDYLTQIVPPKSEKTVDAIQTITRALKALAKELAVPVILLSQLNREGAEKPILQNLRSSGAIEQDADIVIFLHRPEESRRYLLELIIAKHRNGVCDSTYLEANMERMRFTETDERPQPVHQPRVRGFGGSR